MFITPALAQTGGAGGGDFLTSLLPLVLIVAVMYFILIRPQQKRAKAHREMVMAIRRGDKVVVSGGILGTVSKVVDDYEVDVEIAKGVSVRVIKHTISEVRAKTEPVKDKAKLADEKPKKAIKSKSKKSDSAKTSKKASKADNDEADA